MTKQSHTGKLIIAGVVALVIAIGGYGYFNQSKQLQSEEKKVVEEVKKLDLSALVVKPNDIIIGDANALVTIVEYSSLSCPHCQHFHEKVLPDLQKEFITPGKAKLVFRHFPLNDAALKAAQLVECSGGKGTQRSNFVKVLFEMQSKWAFSDEFVKDLKKIALVGGLDSAAFDSCMNDKDLESRLLASRIDAAQKLDVSSTPTFFVNGTKIQGALSIEELRKAIKTALASVQ